MATRRPPILPLRDRPEPRPAPFDLLPLADPDDGYPSRGEICLMLLLCLTLPIGLIAVASL